MHIRTYALTTTHLRTSTHSHILTFARSLDIESLRHFISDPRIGCEEIDIFKAIQRWGQARCEENKEATSPENVRKYVGTLLPCVRMALLGVVAW